MSVMFIAKREVCYAIAKREVCYSLTVLTPYHVVFLWQVSSDGELL